MRIMTNKFSGHINLAPLDISHALHMLPRQVEVMMKLGAAEIVLTYDLSRVPPGREEQWEVAHANMERLFETVSKNFGGLIRVQYLDEAFIRKAHLITGASRVDIPRSDFRGAPFAQYVLGFEECLGEHIFHIDSDMFLIGGGRSWLEEAVQLLGSDSRVFSVSPLPGPPAENGTLRKQRYSLYNGKGNYYEFHSFSSRVFFAKKSRVLDFTSVRKPSLLRCAWALAKRFPLVETLEDTVTSTMRDSGVVRVDFAGANNFWSLHPLRRPPEFCEAIPQLWDKFSRGDVHPSQLGYYNMVDEVFDTSRSGKPIK